jgi:hypothetical protein
MATENFGIGHVDPTNGSDGNTGYGWDVPKATIQSALTAGFSHIKIIAGLHSVSSITSPVELTFLPGTHVFSAAPVVCTAPINLTSEMTGHANEMADDGGVIISASSSVSDYFQIANGNNNLNGGMVAGIRFDQAQVTRSAIYTSNVSNFVSEANRWVGPGTWITKPLLYAAVTDSAGMYSSYWRLSQNRVFGGPLLVVDNDYDKLMNGWVLRDNSCYGGNGSSSPFIYVSGANGQSQGWLICNNKFVDVTSAVAAVHMEQPTNQFYFYGNRGRDLTNTNNLILQCNDVGSGYIEHSLGDAASDGNVKLNGQVYSQTAPDTGDDGRGGRDDYDDTDELRIVMMGRY